MLDDFKMSVMSNPFNPFKKLLGDAKGQMDIENIKEDFYIETVGLLLEKDLYDYLPKDSVINFSSIVKCIKKSKDGFKVTIFKEREDLKDLVVYLIIDFYDQKISELVVTKDSSEKLNTKKWFTSARITAEKL